MRAHFRRFALVLIAALGCSGLSAVADAAESRKGAIVRVEIQDESGEKARTTAAVWWGSTAELELTVGGHRHVLAVTPSGDAEQAQLAIDHSRDGALVADDVVIATPGGRRTVVVEHGASKVKLTVVPTQAQVATH